ncbi:MAG: pyruvate, phosphate dikinase [bacterium]|jgi:pyruvate,orthophosphate dikinase
MARWAYLFEDAEGTNKDKFGGKGANLASMVALGLPIPPGFIITTDCCREYYRGGEVCPEGLIDEVKERVNELEQKTGRVFGGSKNPLLVSVRSGAKFSMPGMMDTILNLGLNSKTVEALAAETGNKRFVLDSQRRFIQIFSDVVLGIHVRIFDDLIEAMKEKHKLHFDHELTAEHLSKLIEQYRDALANHGAAIPEDPFEQLEMAIIAVFRSWNSPRAIAYRKLNRIPHDLGTAVNVQAMVFGNMGDDCGTGVAFSRNKNTGDKGLFGDFLVNAQGEDVVAGIRTPINISKLREVFPKQAKQLEEIAKKLEKHYRDMQDLEFTIERGKLYILQTRSGKRSPLAAVKIAVDMVREGLITRREALMRVDAEVMRTMLLPQIDYSKNPRPVASGVDASPGAAKGKIAFTADEAVERAGKGEKIILVRAETTPEDIHGMAAAQGILTSRGGKTSHAAVVAGGMGKPCVAGCGDIKIDEQARKVYVANHTLTDKDTLTIDGTTGKVFAGEVAVIPAGIGSEFKEFLSWADAERKIKIRTNADTPKDATQAIEFGAEGIGLCRTEHMFFDEERIPFVQSMILSDTPEEREKWLAKLLEYQRDDFMGIFKAMKGYPVTIRLLDPPLHEFLPSEEAALEKVIKNFTAGIMDKSERAAKESHLRARVKSMHEANPMLGFRGCRLGIIYPEINRMQVRAIIEAAIEVEKKGQSTRVEIMIPLIGSISELERVEKDLRAVAEAVMKEKGRRIDYLFGTMIEVPRAALTSDEIARSAEFFSFGTNDLTQMTLGISRDDAEEKFLRLYVDMGLYPVNPFAELDFAGVGKLVKMSIELGRQTRPTLKVGICGEHGGNPATVEFCHRVGMDYVSCSPYRVPTARLAAAQAVLRDMGYK